MERTEPLLSKEADKDLSRKEADADKINLKTSKLDSLIFFALGVGPNWGFITSLYLELPWFERSQPEGIDLAAWMGVAGTLGTALPLSISFFCSQKLSGARVALFLIIFNIIIILLMAFC